VATDATASTAWPPPERHAITNSAGGISLGIRSWSQYFLKWVVSHPAVTVVLAATSDPAHLTDNMEACRGPLPDAGMRTRMLEHLQAIPDFDRVTDRRWYPGKRYPGVVNRAMAAVQARTSWRPSGTV
jgi:diketogulonate reductase-like aldo/keto reductase